MMKRTFQISDALQSLVPGTSWTYSDDDLSTLEWLDENVERPTDDEITAEIARLQTEFDAIEYQRLRASEYPDFREYLDGIVKGDDAQIQAYVDACLAVKAKYPKPDANA